MAIGLAVALGLPACSGDIVAGNQPASGAGASGTRPGQAVGGAGGAQMPPLRPPAAIDPGRVGIHRLNNTEYNNTVRDLFGTKLQPAAKFLAEEGLQFDNTATALGMTPAQYEGYLNAANDLVVESLANEPQRSRFMTCVPTGAGDACARQIIQTFGAKIYRRPLEPAEVDRAVKLYDADFARTMNGGEAIGQVLRAFLASANFLYRIEHDAAPASTTPHPLSGYELASRLSYLLWSSMPDEALFACGLHPKRLAPSLTAVEAMSLHRHLRRILRAAIKARGSTLSDYVDAYGQGGKFALRHKVYGREGQPCPACATPEP